MKSILLVLFVLISTSVSAADEPKKTPVDFQKIVAPIIERHCLSCHAGKNAKGKLNLTHRLSLLNGGESGPAIVPGNPQKSSLLAAISGREPEMPKNGKPLSARKINSIRQWIAQGAVWPNGIVLKGTRKNWWSFQPLNASQPPEISQPASQWVRTPIDAFILSTLQQQGLRPSGDANRLTLIRRLTFDLHGLPPTPREIDSFLNDKSPNAYEKVVARLLASPRYGERWGRHWLDIVHYGDTHGFDKDKRRPNAWPYRDYAVRSFNSDKPYGQFVREQLAGDVIHPNNPAGIIATGFIVAGPWDFVGHVELREGTLDKKITRNLDRDDMVMNTMSTFTSLTVHCARCHDHKFDPIRQKEYYQLQSVFAGVERAVRPLEQNRKTAIARSQLASKLKTLDLHKKQLLQQVAKQAGPELAKLDARIAQLSALPKGNSRPEFGYHSQIGKRQNVAKWVQVDFGKPTKIDQIVIVGCNDSFAGIGAGFGFPVRYKIEISNDETFRKDVSRIVDRTKADVPNPGITPISVRTKSMTARYIRVTATKLAERQNDYIFALAELSALTADGKNMAYRKKVTSLDSIQAPVRWQRRNLVDGYSHGVSDQKTAMELVKLKSLRTELWNRTIDAKTRKQQSRLLTEIQQTQSKLSQLPPMGKVFAAASWFTRQGKFSPAPNGKPRTIHLLNRGSVKSPGEVVGPGTVKLIEGLPSEFRLTKPNDEASRRLALANWIVEKRNPLTWRSIVNRVWQFHFGRGIVDSPNDFGRMGFQPTHSELLDWLALQFRDNGQSMKSLHRLIVTSSVYRQKSFSDAAREKIDGGNRFLWRMHRRRLEAEALRDTVLSVTNQLNSKMYGPGFDLFGFENDHSPRYHYDKLKLNDRRTMRRTVYRFIVRSVPDPFMESLDCADPSINVPKRNTTITAIQALALLNNRFMVHQAQQFAARLQQENPTLSGQITAGFRLALGRPPTQEELTLLQSFAREHGLANCCRLIFNMNEFLFVD